MVNEEKVREGFRKAKEDVEGLKNEVAFALRRIAKIEEVLNKKALEKVSKGFDKKFSGKKKFTKIA